MESSNRSNSPSNRKPVQKVTDEEIAALETELKKEKSGNISKIVFIPFALLTGALGVLLYLQVGGVIIEDHLNYLIGSYLVAVIGLTLAYSNVATWCLRQRTPEAPASKVNVVAFTLFYNNAFYVFMLLICSHVICYGMRPAISLCIAQTVATLIPAWLSSFSVHK